MIESMPIFRGGRFGEEEHRERQEQIKNVLCCISEIDATSAIIEILKEQALPYSMSESCKSFFSSIEKFISQKKSKEELEKEQKGFLFGEIYDEADKAYRISKDTRLEPEYKEQKSKEYNTQQGVRMSVLRVSQLCLRQYPFFDVFISAAENIFGTYISTTKEGSYFEDANKTHDRQMEILKKYIPKQ